MAGNDEVLRENAKLLIGCERELLAMRRKHKSLASWLEFTQSLTERVHAQLDLPKALSEVSERMVAVLELHSVAFFRIEGARLCTIARSGGPKDALPIELQPIAMDHLLEETGGACLETRGGWQLALSQAVGLHRFLWHRLVSVGASDILFTAGFDRERARFYAPFDEHDLAHFSNSARQLGLLLGNQTLVRELEHDKQALLRFKDQLEQRVEERTRELEQAFARVRQKDLRLAEDIEEARLFQAKIFSEPCRSPYLDFGHAYRPLERVGGDVFDVCELDPEHFRVFLADATGHGVQAAMRTILIKTEYDRLKLAVAAPQVLLHELNRKLVTLFPNAEIMCTGCCVDVAVDPSGAQVTYANAGNAPLWHWAGGTPVSIYGDTPFLGVGSPIWPTPLVFRMAPGDTLLVASDGLTEQTNERGEIFEDSVKAWAIEAVSTAAECVGELMRRFDAFRGDRPLSDDVTLVALKLPWRSG